MYGKLQSQRELLTESGEFASQDTVAGVDENAATKRGIPYYQKSLDLLAHTFATEFNKINQGYLVNPKGEYIDPTQTDGTVLKFTNPADPAETYTLNKMISGMIFPLGSKVRAVPWTGTTPLRNTWPSPARMLTATP